MKTGKYFFFCADNETVRKTKLRCIIDDLDDHENRNSFDEFVCSSIILPSMFDLIATKDKQLYSMLIKANVVQ